MVATQRKAEFERWLVAPNGGNVSPFTKINYISAIDRFQKELLSGNNFYVGDIAMIDTIREENKLAFDAINEKTHGALNAAINKYRDFLQDAPAFAPVVVHKAPQNIDVTQYVTEALLVNLFIKTYKTNFPGYEIYREAQGRNCKDFSVLLEHPAEKKALFVVLLPQSPSNRPHLIENILSDFDTLEGLFKKEGKELSVLVVAGSFEQNFKTACKCIPSIRLMRYSLGALALQDVAEK